jgi:hypothetical protein
MKYLEKAASKDETRMNLQHVVRREFDAFATDGHRLHRQLNLARTTPHVVGATDLKVEDCPSIDVLLPDAEKAMHFFTIKLDKKQMRKLEEVAKLTKYGLLKTKFTRKAHDKLELQLTSHTFTIAFTLDVVKFTNEINDGDILPIQVNFAYFVDALIVDQQNEVHINNNPMMVVRTHYYDGSFEAIVMGMK